MPTGTLPKPDQDNDHNVGQRHSDDLFKHFEQQYQNPTGSSVGEDAAIDRAKAASQMAQAEEAAAKSAGAGDSTGPKTAVGTQEREPRSPLLKDYYRRSKELKAKGGNRRGLFIGLGAGGGILSVIAGFAFLLPFKLPGIMDGVVDFTGERVERVVERRAEKIIMQFVIRGSSASVANGTAIVTGNPIGDLFANLRTAKFEEKLLEQYGLKLEPTTDKRVKIVHDGRDMGSFRDVEQLQQLLNRDDLNTKEIREAFKLLVKNEHSGWYRFFLRAKFVNWLRLKYNIQRFGVREAQEGEKPEEHRLAVQEDHIENSANASLENMTDLANCALSGECENASKLGGAQQLADQTAEATKASAKELAQKVVSGEAVETLTKSLVTKLVGSSAAGLIPYVGQIDLAARLMHLAGEETKNNVLQKKHAEYIGKSSAVLAAAYAGYADQTKAGEMPPEIVGDFANRFNGMEESASYDVMQGGDGKGVRLEEMEKINENVSSNTFAQFGKDMFNTVGWVGRAPLEAWYYTVSQVLDLVGDLVGDATSWVISHVPGAQAMINQMVGYMGFIFEGIMKLVGMYIDPLAVGAKLHLYVTQGFTEMFNEHAKELGMRKLSPEQASAISRQIAQERAEELKQMPVTERLFNLNDTRSLASALIQGMPSVDTQNPLTSMAFAGAKLVARAPGNFASLTTPRAKAAGYVDLFGKNIYGGTEGDVAAPLSPEGTMTNDECPENNPDGNGFNHCRVDRAIVESINCSVIVCEDLVEYSTSDPSTETGLPSGDTQTLATQLMEKIQEGKVTFEPGDDDGARQDIERAARGESTQCDGNKVNLNPNMLGVLLKLTENYTYRINALVSDHSCNNGYHPRGQAADLGWVNGKRAIEDVAFYRDFANYLVTILPNGSEIGQKNCLGSLNIPAGSNIEYHNDSCNHIHFGVPQ